MTKHIKAYIKQNLPYYTSIPTKNRYKGIKAKAWGILSDYVRCRDFILYGRCVATGKKFNGWRDSQGGHYYAVGNGGGALISFDVLNVHAQDGFSNKMSSAADGAMFRDTLIERYGEGIIKHLNSVKLETVKADDLFFIKKIQEVWKLFQELKAQHPRHDYPDYLSPD